MRWPVAGQRPALVLACNLHLGPYDRSRPLIIDPVLHFSTFLGGSIDDSIMGMTPDGMGNVYVTGHTTSSDFPTAGGGFAGSDWTDVFVAKLNPFGTALIYSTFLGGTNHDSFAAGIAVDASGNAYVAGTTFATNFPTVSAYQPTAPGGGNGFVAKLNPAGNALLYATYFGGSDADEIHALTLDASGNTYITGSTLSANLPTTPGAPQPALASPGYRDGFAAKLGPTGAMLVYSTYLGGTRDEQSQAVTVDSAGQAYVTGWTGSSNFPTTPGAFQELSANGPLFRSTDAGAQWRSVGRGLPPDIVNALTADYGTPPTLYLGAETTGLWKSTDGGATFTAATTGLPASGPIRAIAMDPSTSTTLYTSRGASDPGRVYKSTNSGATWNSVGTISDAMMPGATWSITALALDPSGGGATMYAGVQGLYGPSLNFARLYRSTDSGATWTSQFHVDNGWIYAIDIHTGRCAMSTPPDIRLE